MIVVVLFLPSLVVVGSLDPPLVGVPSSLNVGDDASLKVGAVSSAAEVVVGVFGAVVGVDAVRVGAVGAVGAVPVLVVGVLGAVGVVRVGALRAGAVGAGAVDDGLLEMGTPVGRMGEGVAGRIGAGVTRRAGEAVAGLLEGEGGLVVGKVSNLQDLSSTRTLTIWELMVELNTLALLLSCMVSFSFSNRNNEDSLTYTVMLQCT